MAVSLKAKTEKVKEALQPKQAINRYIYFNIESSAKIRAKNPDVKMPMSEVSKQVSKKWKAMSEDQRKPYEVK